ncbi:MAG: radical SAM protein [Myxococcota bacterium]|jgi:radical SAM protein with 4Fe4S-binding SPASM domain|nr:radical SAM protein [Myxococcota bacterium]
MEETSARQRILDRAWLPRSCVWEITLACNLRCGHCGSRAGKARADELSTQEAVDVAGQLADLGCQLVSLSGGEPTVRDDWDVIARALVDRGVLCNMVSNGFYDDPELMARRAKDCGMVNVGISVDGTKEVHEQIRGRNTFAKTTRAIEVYAKHGMRPAMMTTICKSNLGQLEEIRQLAIELGASMWRLQLSKPMGTMSEHRDDVLEPAQYVRMVETLAALKKKGGIDLRVGDSIGYYGAPEAILRNRRRNGKQEMWRGCQAGLHAIGIEANGNVKGCLSLQAKWGESDPFVEGNLHEQSLEQIWFKPGGFAYNRELCLEELTGACANCKNASVCKGGARCVSSAMLGTLTEDPLCYYAIQSQRRGPRWAESAAAIAAAALLTASASGCISATDYGVSDYGIEPADQVDQLDISDQQDQEVDFSQTEYGVDLGPDQSDYGLDVRPDYQLEYGIDIPPDGQTDYGVDVSPDGQTDYGVDVSDEELQTDYGVPQP